MIRLRIRQTGGRRADEGTDLIDPGSGISDRLGLDIANLSLMARLSSLPT